MDRTTDQADVELTLPATTRFLRLARLTAFGFATDLGVSVDEIEELRLAVDEACAMLVDEAPEGARLSLTYEVGEGSVVITARAPSADGGGLSPHPVAEAVLATTVDDHEVLVGDDGANVVRLVKRLAPKG